MNPPLSAVTPSTRTEPRTDLPTDLPATWVGLRTALVQTCQIADALRAAHPLAWAPEVPMLCATAADALATARATVQPPPAQAGAGHANSDSDPTVLSQADLAEALAQAMALAVQVLDNHDETLTSDDVLAISHAVTALCSARAALGGALR